MRKKIQITKVIFWLFWAALLVLLPFYLFTFLFEIGAVKPEKIASIISPIIGALVIIAQIAIFVFSFKQARQNLPLSKLYLTLLGGSIIIGFVWAGGCAIMGPYRIAG